MDEHAVRILELGKIMRLVCDHAATTYGRELCASLCPHTRLSEAKLLQQETEEARRILDDEGSFHFGGITDIRLFIEQAAIGSLLQPSDLVAVCYTVQSCAKLKVFISKFAERRPRIAERAKRMSPSSAVVKEITAAISSSAEVLDRASPALARVRSEARRNASVLTERMQSFLQNTHIRTALQDPVITIRGERYCLSVKSEYRSQVPGIVHDSSSSGATLFVEPASVVELGNRRRELVAREREEVAKVLARLTGVVGAASAELSATLRAAAELDAIAARASYATSTRSVCPVLNDQGIVRLVSARHPLLGPDAVPIDVTLGDNFNALLITGPNTGGKTVSLKTIGLFALMAASGLQLPVATGCEVAIFENVYADIGDEQSIEQSLSTFSSHMRNIVRITSEATRNSLVLLDEIGAGTDPAEGAALAKAVLDHLLAKNCRIVATTHYGELKEFAYLRDGIQNACVEFDPETLRPTYRLLIGVPGSSNAFAIAGRLGLSGKIIESARSNLTERSHEAADLIQKVEETQRAASLDRVQARRMSSEAQTLKETYERELAQIESVRRRAREKVKDAASEIIKDYSQKLDVVLEELARQRLDVRRSNALAKRADKLIDEVGQQVSAVVGELEPEEKLPNGFTLVRGTRLRIAGMSKDVEVLETLSDSSVLVLAGTMKVTVPVASLRLPSGPPAREEVRSMGTIEIALEKARDIQPEISLRAKRVEPALRELDKYVDDAVAAGLPNIRIIHGKGTGAMKKAVIEYLNHHSCVASYRPGEPGEGGTGVIVATLKR